MPKEYFHILKWIKPLFNLVINVFKSMKQLHAFRYYVWNKKHCSFLPCAHIRWVRCNEIYSIFISLIEVALSRTIHLHVRVEKSKVHIWYQQMTCSVYSIIELKMVRMLPHVDKWNSKIICIEFKHASLGKRANLSKTVYFQQFPRKNHTNNQANNTRECIETNNFVVMLPTTLYYNETFDIFFECNLFSY